MNSEFVLPLSIQSPNLDVSGLSIPANVFLGLLRFLPKYTDFHSVKRHTL